MSESGMSESGMSSAQANAMTRRHNDGMNPSSSRLVALRLSSQLVSLGHSTTDLLVPIPSCVQSHWDPD